MFKTVFVGLVLTGAAAHAVPFDAFDNSYNCDAMLNTLVGGANIAAPNSYDEIIKIENGRAKTNKNSPRIKAYKSDDKYVEITFTKDVIDHGMPKTVKETVRYEVDKEGYLINYYNDMSAMDLRDPSVVHRTKARIGKLGNGNCSYDQFSQVMGTPMGPVEVVIQDKQFCESVKGLVAQMGQKSFSECNSLLDKAAEAYNARAQELAKKNMKLLVNGDAPKSNIAVTLQALNTCSPDEWYDRASTPMGMKRTLKAYPNVASKPAAATGSSVQKGIKEK